MNGELFDLYIETQLVPTLRPGDVVILDNLSSHKSPGAAKAKGWVTISRYDHIALLHEFPKLRDCPEVIRMRAEYRRRL